MKLIWVFCLCILFLGNESLFSTPILYDFHSSPYSGSNNLICVQNELLNFQNRFKSPGSQALIHHDFSDLFLFKKNYQLSALEGGMTKNIFKMTLRAGELMGIWHPLNFMTSVLQHEVFGHGYRMRSFGRQVGHVIGYKMAYGFDWKGLYFKEAYTASHFKRNPSFSEKISMSIAGLEANFIMAHNLVFSWLERGTIDGRQASLWRRNQFACSSYVQTLKRGDGMDIFMYGWTDKGAGHDIASYFSWLNYCYGSEQDLDEQMDTMRIKAGLSVILNPFTYLSYLSEIAYVFFNSSIPIFAFSDENYKLLPAYKMGLTPFGVEDIFELFVWGKDLSPTYFYTKFGEFSANKYVGLGVENRKMLLSKWGSFGLKTDLWVQPSLLLAPIQEEKLNFEGYQQRLSDSYKRRAGMACSVIYQNISEKNPNIRIWVQLGAKTQGFVPGESLRAAPIAKLGALFTF